MLSPAAPVRVDPQTGVQTGSTSAGRSLTLSRLFHNVCQALFPCGVQLGKSQAEETKTGVNNLSGQIDAGRACDLMQGQHALRSLPDFFAGSIIRPDQRPVQGNILNMAGKTLFLIPQHSIGHKNDPS